MKSLSIYWKQKYFVPLACILLFAVIGVIILFVSRAATPFASLEVENGTKTGVTATADNKASGSSYVQFGTKTIQAGRFTKGICGSGGCTVNTGSSRYNLYVPDADTSGCLNGETCGTPKTVAPPIFISRPGNLSSAPAPLVLAFVDSTNSDWEQAAAGAVADDGGAGPYVLAIINTAHNCKGTAGCEYAMPTAATAPTCGNGNSACNLGPYPDYQDCGTAGNISCDDIPSIAYAITALENCSTPTSSSGTIGDWVASGTAVPAWGNNTATTGNGAPPCQNINPKEVYVEGGSRGGDLAWSVACDTRTSTLVAGIQTGSWNPSINSMNQPNCPALLPISSATCISDCVAAQPNKNISIQWLWGSVDTASNTGSCVNTNPSNNCRGVGWSGSFGLIPMATTVIGHPVLGCSTTASKSVTTGTTNHVFVTTYTGCTNPGAATQTVEVNTSGHLPDTWPYGSTNGASGGIICTSSCTTKSASGASDGFIAPLAAWQFWQANFAL